MVQEVMIQFCQGSGFLVFVFMFFLFMLSNVLIF